MRKNTTTRSAAPLANEAKKGPGPSSFWWWQVLPAAGLLAVIFFIYWPVVSGGWLWDDNTEITQNLDLRSGSGGLAKIWTGPSSPDYFPLKATVQWLQWRLWEDRSTEGYHLTNILLHWVSVLLFWRLLRKLGLRFAWLGAVLLAVHPLVVESVAWIAELKNALSLPFALLAMSAYLDFDTNGRRRSDYLAALGWFIAAMLCKTSVVMLPFALLLYVFWRRGRIFWCDVFAALPFFAVSLALGVVTLWFQHHRAIGTSEVVTESVVARLVNAGAVVGFYLWRSIFPFDLSPVYPRWTIDPLQWWQIFAWPLLGILFVITWRKRAAWGRVVLFALGFFILNLVPVLGVIPISYLQISWVADHLVYFPLLGVAGLFAGAVGMIATKVSGGARMIVSLVCGALLLVLAVDARLYARNFSSAETLWSTTLQRHPEAWLAQNNYGVILLRRGQAAEALPYLQKATELNPRYASARVNLGNALAQLRRADEAFKEYNEALRLEPDSPEAHFNLGNLLVQDGKFPEAIAHYEQALRVGPPSVDILYNLGNALAQTEHLDEAERRYEEALRLNPNSFEVNFNLGNVSAARGQYAAAIQHFKKAAQLMPSSADAHASLGELYAQAGNWAEAASEFEQALRQKPADKELELSLREARRHVSAKP